MMEEIKLKQKLLLTCSEQSNFVYVGTTDSHTSIDNIHESLYANTIEEQAKKMTDQKPLQSIVQDSVYK